MPLLVLLALAFPPPAKYSMVELSKVRKGWWSATVRLPKFVEGGPVCALANRALGAYAKRRLNEWTSQAVAGMTKPEAEWTDEYDSTVDVALPSLIGVTVSNTNYSGGAHPNLAYVFFHFGLARGRPKAFTLADCFKPKVRGPELVSRLVLADLRAKRAAWVLSGEVKALAPEQGDEFAIKSDRLAFMFAPYEMGSYAEGPYEVDVMYKDLGAKLDPNGPLGPLLKAARRAKPASGL